MSERTPAATRIASVISSLTSGAPRRVLIVDDEEAIRSAVSKFLRARGYDAVAVEGGVQALDQLQQERFDALLCDVRMPGMTGVDVVPRALELSPDLAILMLTAVNDAPTATEALSQGAMDYLMKPVELADLVLAVERALHKRDVEIQRRSVERLIREEVAVRTEELHREKHALAEASISILRTLVNAHEAKNVFFRGHSERVRASSASIASMMRLADSQVEDVRLAGQLHDLGKIGVPERLLSAPGPLTPDEHAQMREHVRIGVELLSPLTSLARVIPAIQDHHERYDGSGYPRQLAGEQISLGGRILAAADAYDALTSRGPYREPVLPEESIVLLAHEAGRHLDPSVFEALRQVVRSSEGARGAS